MKHTIIEWRIFPGDGDYSQIPYWYNIVASRVNCIDPLCSIATILKDDCVIFKVDFTIVLTDEADEEIRQWVSDAIGNS